MKNLYLIIFIFLLSCKSEKQNELQENAIASPLEWKITKISIPLDFESLNEYVLLNSFEQDGHNYLYAFNDKTFAIDIFSIDSCRLINHISLSQEGPNGINRRIRGLCVHSMDSIFLYGSNLLYLIDEYGSIKKKYNLFDKKYFKNLPHGTIIMDNNYAVATMKLHYNAKEKSITFVYWEDENTNIFNIAEFLIETGKVKLYPIKFPEYYKTHEGHFGWMKFPNVEVATPFIYYNFPVESNMYQYDMRNGEIKAFGGKSKFTNNIAEPIKDKSLENLELYKFKNIHFHEPILDPFKKLIYRIHVKEMNTEDFSDDVHVYQKKEMFLTVFNLNFEVLNEIKLKKNTYSIYTNWFVNSKGLYLTAYNPYSEDINFEELRFDCYTFY